MNRRQTSSARIVPGRHETADLENRPSRGEPTLLQEVLEGLQRPHRTLPCKLFYDERGAALFEEICRLDEYYPTRTEIGILEQHVEEMVSRLGPRCLLIEFGTGDGQKTRMLLDRLQAPVGFVSVDISAEQLDRVAARLAVDYPELEILPVCGDYTQELALPTPRRPAARHVTFFPGSTIGNFEPPEAEQFLGRVSRLCGVGGALLIGVDLRKDRRVLEAAYDDARGITAEFNLNLLRRLNRELGTNFDLGAFEHRAVYNETAGRIEMRLVCLRAHTVIVGGVPIRFAVSEAITTEHCYKYTVPGFAQICARAGFELEQVWTDDDRRFSVQLYRVTDGAAPR